LSLRAVAICARGTEIVLAAELGALGVPGAAAGEGAVFFEGGLEAAYRACLWSRVASRVLWPVAELEAANADALYQGVRAVAWHEHLDVNRTFAVRAVGRHPELTDLRYVALKAKDAVVDQLRDACGARPNVDRHRPDVPIHLHLDGNRVAVSLDLSGEALHRRGYRPQRAAAPLKESLAAAILRLAGWPEAAARGAPLVDPLCGSATLLVEAVGMARDVAPGLGPRRFGFEGWRGHRAPLWDGLLREANERQRAARAVPVQAFGYDADPAALEAARESVRRAGVGDAVRLEQRALADASPPPGATGLVVTNPPYGERLGDTTALVPLYETLGDVLRRRFLGWDAFVLTGSRELARHVGLKPHRRHVLFNGPIECRLLHYPIAKAPAQREGAPRWRGKSADAEMFENRLRKNLRRVRRALRQEDTTCYRLYDRDIPEYNVVVDVYEGSVHVQEYERPRSVDERRAADHLRDVRLVVPEVLGVSPEEVFVKVRRRQRGGAQYGKSGDRSEVRFVREGGLRFEVNLSDYLDTGLFLDERELRTQLRARAQGKRFLNLFAYTGSATVYAAAGGAAHTTSVDLSNTYLAWARRNLEHNELWDPRRHELVRADVMEWVGRSRGTFDLVFAAPPRYSRSKGMAGDMDLSRDQRDLLGAIERRLAPGGVLYFVGTGPEPEAVRQAYRKAGKELRYGSRD
jgi:23S rRNA (guanine2445-N2)-methyltransferase / 23S rRNA (guanine2069-N7)-methyltransferase